jgi:adenine-specific DNA-methyltransferase
MAANKLSNQKLNGVVYTPKWIVELILDHIDYKNNICHKRIIDPACGDGAFLTNVLERFIADARRKKFNKQKIKKIIEKNIFGFDIEDKAIKSCILTLNEIARKHDLKNIKWQIIKTDALDKSFIEKFLNSFDFVVGNPPYIRIQHLGLERRKKIQHDWALCQKGSTDIFIAFFELGYYLLNRAGKLGYITPNTYLKTKAGESLREFIKESQSLKTLIDFEHNQLFENATTYSVITILDKNHRQNTFKLYKGDVENVNYVDELSVENLNKNNWILTSNNALEKLKTIERRGMSLSRIAKIHVGITTLADDFYIFKDPKLNNNHAEITLEDGRSFRIERSVLKPIIKASTLKDPDENQNRFIIFPYRKINNRHVIIPENELKSKFPLTYKYFLAIKENLDKRDKGKPNKVAWYAFGRSQGLDTSFGKKILTSPINLRPNFIVWEKEDYTFYAGYCVKFSGDLKALVEHLNSRDMEFYINHVSRNYQSNYKSFAKSFIERFGVKDVKLFNGQQALI